MGVTNTNAYDGPFYPNGVTTSFPFTFRTMSTSEVQIVGEDGETVAGFSFSIVPAMNGDGGTIIFDTPPTATQLPAFLIASEPNFGVGIDLGSVTAFNPRTLNPSFERLAVQNIFLRDRVDRSPKIPLGGGKDIGKFARVGPDGWEFSPGLGKTAAALGVPDEALNMGSGFGPIVADDSTAKDAFLALETALAPLAVIAPWSDRDAPLSVYFGVTDQASSLEGGAPKVMLTRNGNLAFLQVSVTARDKSAPAGGFTEDDVLRVAGLPIVANGIQPQLLQLEPGTGLPEGAYAALVGDSIGFYTPTRQPVKAEDVADTYFIRATGLVAVLPEDEV